MKQLDLTNPDDILEFSRNFKAYKESVSLPADIYLKIEKQIYQYNKGMITSTELNNLIADTIVSFMHYLDVEIKRT